MAVLGKMMPMAFLILFGYILQRLNYLEDTSFHRIQHFILKVTIPCVLFTAFANMEVDSSYLWVSVSIILLLLLLLALGFLLFRLFHFKYDFFKFYLTTFGFGTVGLPMFINIFGLENSHYMALLGVGHELFVGAVYLPLLQLYFSGTRLSAKSIGKSLCSPSMIMVALGLIVCLFDLRDIIAANFIGEGLLGAISSLGNLTLALAMVLVGYRIRFNDRSKLGQSMIYAGIRITLVLALSLAYKFLLLDHLVAPDKLLDHALYMLVLQHSSIMLLLFVGQYRPLEDQIMANNAFVISLVVGVVLMFLYMLLFV